MLLQCSPWYSVSGWRTPMAQCSWGANIRMGGQEIPCHLWNPTVCCSDHNNPSMVTFLSQINPIHNLILYFFKINFYNILSSTPASSKWFIYFRFSDKNVTGISCPWKSVWRCEMVCGNSRQDRVVRFSKHADEQVGSEVLTAMSTKMAVFWVVAPCPSSGRWSPWWWRQQGPLKRW
jgi:hypothetical protein